VSGKLRREKQVVQEGRGNGNLTRTSISGAVEKLRFILCTASSYSTRLSTPPLAVVDVKSASSPVRANGGGEVEGGGGRLLVGVEGVSQRECWPHHPSFERLQALVEASVTLLSLFLFPSTSRPSRAANNLRSTTMTTGDTSLDLSVLSSALPSPPKPSLSSLPPELKIKIAELVGTASARQVATECGIRTLCMPMIWEVG
jgi:hypothetical protein